jgi:hypothetical protein
MFMNRTMKISLGAPMLLGLLLLAAKSARLSAHGQGAEALAASGGRSCCATVSGSAQGAATGPVTFVTSVNLTLRGRPFGGLFQARALSAVSTATIIQQEPLQGGMIPVISAHVFELTGQSDGDGQCESGEDCFSTLDRAVLTATEVAGKFQLHSKLGVIRGLGVFEHACGRLEVARGGQVDFTVNPPTVRWEVAGQLCECR